MNVSASSGGVTVGGLPGGGQGLHGQGQGAGGQIGQAGGGEDQEAAVLDDQPQPGGALGVRPADPGLAVGELDGGGPPDQPGDPAAVMLDDLREGVADGLAGAQIVLLLQQRGRHSFVNQSGSAKVGFNGAALW